jgi:3-hydroxybutyryl-CoA dehydratase
LNSYTYNQIFIGQKEDFTIVITEDMQNMFLCISGDNNPMHTDEAYAKSKGFRKGALVYGMLTATFYSTLVGTLLPGKNCLFHEADIKFRKPVYIGDRVKIIGECIDKNDTVKILTVKAKVYNQNDELVSTAKLKVGVLDE